MSAVFMEGFTGLPRAATPFTSNLPLAALGWVTNGRQGGTGTIGADANVTAVIETDPVFADRNVLSLNKQNVNFSSYFLQAIMPLDMTGFDKFVIGGMFMITTADTSANNCILCFGDQTQWTSSTANFPFSNIFVQLSIPNNGTDGQVKTNSGTVTLTTPLVKKGKWTHFELFLEQDTDRVRLYLDGTLVYDATWTGTLASASSGIGLTVLRQGSTGTLADQHKFSNLYVLGVDAIHTGIVGPAARVLEIAPQTDVDVHLTRPAGYDTNAAVLNRAYNVTTSDYLFGGEPLTDLYGGFSTVAANATQVYGAVMKVRAFSMAEGDHAIAAAARSGSSDFVGSVSYSLSLGTLKSFSMDVSKNPATNALWTPAQISAASIGFRLVR